MGSEMCIRDRPLSVFEHVVVVVVVVFVGELIPKQKRDARRRRVTRTFSHLASSYLDDVR